MASLTALLLLCLVFANYVLHRDLMYPGFVQATLWFVAIVLIALSDRLFVPVSDTVFVLLTLGVLLFSIGAFVGSYDHRPYKQRNYVLQGTLPSRRAVRTLATIVALGLVLYINRVVFLAATGPSTNPFVNLRFAVSINQEETGGIGFVQYFVWLAYLLVAIAILQRKGLSKGAVSPITVVVTVIIGLTFGVLSSGRGPVLALIIILVGIPLTLRATRPGRATAGFVLFALLLFVTVGVALGKGGTVGSGLAENWVTMRESFLTYSAGGIPALSQFVQNRGPQLDWGFNSLRSLFAVLKGLGFNTTAAPLVQPYADIPMPFNAYTVYQPYIKDFGLVGAVPVLFLLGFLHAFLYRRATTRDPHAIYVFLFAISMFPLVMQVFQDMYLSLLSLWIQYGIYSVIFFVLLSDSRKQPQIRRLGPEGS